MARDRPLREPRPPRLGRRGRRARPRRRRARALPGARRRLRNRLPHAPSSGRRRRPRSERRHGGGRERALAARRDDGRAMPCRSRFATASSTVSSRATSTAIFCRGSARRSWRKPARAARELVIVDSALRPDQPPELWQERVLEDGSRHRVYKRYFSGSGLAAEVGASRTLFDGAWFVAVAAP